MNDFAKTTKVALSKRGVHIIGLTVIPDMSKALPFASGERGYRVDDNGCGRVWTFAQVLEAAQ